MMTKALFLLIAPLTLFAHDLMPAPAKIQVGRGRLRIDGSFRVELTGYREARLESAAARLTGSIARSTGIPMRPDATVTTLLVHCGHASAAVQEAREDESYRLVVTSQQARLDAPNPLGVLRGMETFLQMVDLDSAGYGVTAATIDDQPRFPWRGLMLDVGRHWIPLDDVKRTLDGMAAVKLNVFHWHLSDNQGFRVESRRFPKLAELGSDGHYFTQEQVREVIAYARERGIRVIPEFDMPGHATSWFVGYPELASGPGPYAIDREWGVFDAAMDPTREEVYKFLNTFIGEMTALFPDAYFHIGGDELNGKQWDANARIQEFKRAHGWSSNEQLQAYFTRRVQELVEKHGKKMIGWDEVLTPELSRNVMVQSWRGQKSLADAARQGVDGILSHGYYVDLMYSAAEHYAADPLGDGASDLNEEQRRRILGGEATMWSEFVTPEILDARVWPRTAAIAERLWSPAGVTDVADMYRRLDVVSRELEWLGLTHVSQYEKMLQRLAAGGPAGPVRTLAEVVEPVKEYVRGDTFKYTSFTPLNRLVDTARPESAVAREFAALVQARDGAKMRAWLTRWRDNDARFQPVAAKSELLAENGEISRELSTVAAAGLEALDYLERAQHAPPDWMERQTALLDEAKKPKGVLLLSVEPPIRKLIEAVR